MTSHPYFHNAKKLAICKSLCEADGGRKSNLHEADALARDGVKKITRGNSLFAVVKCPVCIPK